MPYIDSFNVDNVAYDMRDKTAANYSAPPYSTSATYNVGDYVNKDYKIYRCITPISVAEAWTPAHWQETTIGEDINIINNNVTTKYNKLGWILTKSGSYNNVALIENSRKFEIDGAVVKISSVGSSTVATMVNITGTPIARHRGNASPTHADFLASLYDTDFISTFWFKQNACYIHLFMQCAAQGTTNVLYVAGKKGDTITAARQMDYPSLALGFIDLTEFVYNYDSIAIYVSSANASAVNLGSNIFSIQYVRRENFVCADQLTQMVANRNYAKNEFIFINNSIYLVTTPIQNGDALISGTNVALTSVGAQLTRILNTLNL